MFYHSESICALCQHGDLCGNPGVSENQIFYHNTDTSPAFCETDGHCGCGSCDQFGEESLLSKDYMETASCWSGHADGGLSDEPDETASHTAYICAPSWHVLSYAT